MFISFIYNKEIIMKSLKATARWRALTLASGVAVAGMAAPLAAQAELTGNIGVYSKYVLRGITNDAENDNTAVQGGLDWSHSSGIYLGYWGSNLDYGKGTAGTGNTNTGFENDIYGGYAFKAGPVDLSVGIIQYFYTQVDDSDGTELVGTVGWGPVKGGFKYLLTDVAWGNKGDIYLTVDYGMDLPMEFKFNASLGFYRYEDSGEFIASSTESSGFRHLNLGLTHPLGKTGMDMGITYIVGGEDRNGVDQHNAIVLSLTTGF